MLQLQRHQESSFTFVEDIFIELNVQSWGVAISRSIWNHGSLLEGIIGHGHCGLWWGGSLLLCETGCTTLWALSLFTGHLGIGKKCYKHESKLLQQNVWWSPENELTNYLHVEGKAYWNSSNVTILTHVVINRSVQSCYFQAIFEQVCLHFLAAWLWKSL